MAENDPDNLAPKICGLCFENISKYCCPRCNVLYCSLACYKSKNHAACSEGFYQDEVHEELLHYHPQDGSQEKMMEILKRMQAGDVAAGGDFAGLGGATEDKDDSDDEEVIDLYERIRGLDLENADALWDSLTSDERWEFESMISHGEIGHLMPKWEPWWMSKKEKVLVKEEGGKNVEEVEVFPNMHGCPVHKKVPELKALTKVEPSKAIRYNITNVLAAYAFTLRYFHGEVEPVEWAIYFLNICNNLDKNTNYEDPAIAVESVVQNCFQSELIKTDKKSLDVMRYDTFLILQGPDKVVPKQFCKSALSHVYRILARARVTAKKGPNRDVAESGNQRYVPKSPKDKTFSKKFPEHHVQNMVKLDVDKLKKCLKKVEYYLSYVESYSMEYELDEE